MIKRFCDQCDCEISDAERFYRVDFRVFKKPVMAEPLQPSPLLEAMGQAMIEICYTCVFGSKITTSLYNRAGCGVRT